MKNRIFLRHVKGAASTINHIFIAEKRRLYRLKAVACGGNGGAGSASACGGGGGAGNYLDFEVLIQPNSLLQVGLSDAGTSVSFYHDQSGFFSVYQLLAGSPGGAAAGATAGVGGDSGCGGEGGILTSVETRYGSGMADADGLAHSCGGQAGWGAALPTSLNADFSYTRGPTTTITRCKNKWPGITTPLAINTPGRGGCSYFGGAASIQSEWGAGGNGGGFNAAGDLGGNAFFSLEWDD